MARFQIRRDSLVRPRFAVCGATQAKSYVEIDECEVRVRLGGLFNQSIPFSNIVGVERANWSLWRGLGVRLSAGHGLGVVGSTDGVVRLRLSPKVTVKVFFNLKSQCEELLLSLDDPDGFAREIDSRIAARDRTSG